MAELIGAPNSSGEEFKLNLFPDVAHGNEGGASGSMDNVINIDLGKQGKSEALKKVMQDFGKIDL